MSNADWISEPWKVLALVNAVLIAALLLGGLVINGLMGSCLSFLGSVAAIILTREVTRWTSD